MLETQKLLMIPERIEKQIQAFTGRTWLLPGLLDWLENTSDRLFVLVGDPGTGKSMLSAWLSGQGPVPAEPENAQRLERFRSQVCAVHFCLANSGNTSPTALARHWAEQLEVKVKGFAEAVLELDRAITVKSSVSAERIESGASVVATYINNLNLGKLLSDQQGFNRLLRDPLKKLYDNGYDDPLVLMVDAVDEAETWTGDTKISYILSELSDLPPKVRVLATTRPDPRVLKYITDPVTDLLKDAPEDIDDIRTFAYNQLHPLELAKRDSLAAQISTQASGVFLYAALVIQDLLQHPSDLDNIEKLRLPADLPDFYRRWLNRELGKYPAQWAKLYKPFLGVLAVAQGEGLTREQLEHVIGRDIEVALGLVKQYLTGELPNGPFRFFHQSFVDFLLDKEKNQYYPIDASKMHEQIVKSYRRAAKGPRAKLISWRQVDNYILRHLAAHLYALKDRAEFRQQLFELICKPFMEAKRARFKSHESFLADIELAWQAAAEQGNTKENIPLLVRLQTARQVINTAVSTFSDIDLQTLVWLGREDEALAHARLRSLQSIPNGRFQGLLAVYIAKESKEGPDPVLLDEIGNAAERIKNDDRKVDSLCMLAGALIRVSQYERANAILYQAYQIANAITDVISRGFAMIELGRALARAGHNERANAVFNQAREAAETITRDDYGRSVILSPLVNALAQAREYEQAWQIADAIAYNPGRVTALRTVAVALTKAGYYERASAVYDRARQVAGALTEAQQRAWDLRDLAETLTKTEKWEQAREAAKAVGDVSLRVEALSDLAGALAGAGQNVQARQVADAIRDDDERARVLRSLAGDLTRAGEWDQALQIADAIPDSIERVLTLSDLAGALARAEEYDRASAVFEQAQAAHAVRMDYRRTEAPSALAGALAQVGHFDAACEIADAITYNYARAFALSRIGLAFAKAGRFDRADTLFQQTRQVADAITNDYRRAEALRELAQSLARAGEYDQSREVADTITKAREKAKALSDLAGALAEAGQYEQSLQVADMIPQSFEKAEALSTLAGALAKAGDYDGASKIAETVTKQSVKALVAISLAVTLTEVGQYERTKAVFHEARQVSNAITNDGSRERVLSVLAAAFAETGQFDPACEIADAIKDDFLKVLALHKLPGALAQAGQFDRANAVFVRACQVVSAITSGRLRDEALSTLAGALAEAGQFEQAWQATDAITVPSLKEEALKQLANILAKAGRFDEALLAQGWVSWDSLNQYLQALAEWAPFFEGTEQTLSLHVLQVAMEVARWNRKELEKYHHLLMALSEDSTPKKLRARKRRTA